MKKYGIVVLFIALFFSSCGTMRFNKTSDFDPLSETNKIDGYYFSWTDANPYALGRRDIFSFFERDTADLVHIKTVEKDKLIISYQNKKGKHEQVYQGKLGKKFFEIYYNKKQLIIPIIISKIDVSRIRIGKTKKGELLINNFAEQSGNFLFLAAGSAEDRFYRFPSVVTPSGLSSIKKNEKWGVINQNGNEIVPFVYDIIMPVTDWGFKVYINGKVGLLDETGKEIAPIIYSYIEQPEKDIIKLRLGDKWGCITKGKVLIPAIYTQLYDFSKDHFLTERDGQRYYVDKEGYEYGMRGGNQLFRNKMVPDLSTKRKVLFEEQNISK